VKKLRKSTIIVLALAISLALVVITPIQAKKPLTGTMCLQYNLAWPGPQAETPDWVGNITIAADGDGETELYDMCFFAIGSGKAFATPPYLGGHIHFFEEIWVIGDIDYTFEDGVLVDFEIIDTLIRGYDKGLTDILSSRYHMNGYVEFVDTTGPFSKWAGRSVHIMGLIEWQNLGTPEEPIIAPFGAPGTFRLN
jgi:hypothetical protein